MQQRLPDAGSWLSGRRAGLAAQAGALLVFDEVITGFRIDLGGAQKHFGVAPDLATFGKAVGGGVAAECRCGTRGLMEQMFKGGVVFGGTFNGNPLSLAGADACLGELSRDGGAALKWPIAWAAGSWLGLKTSPAPIAFLPRSQGLGRPSISISPSGKAFRTIVIPSKITRNSCSAFCTWPWLKA